MTTLSTDELAQQLPQTIELVKRENERIVITKDGEQVCAVISVEDLRLLEQFIEHLEDVADRRAVEEAIAEGLDPTPFEDFRKELGL